MCECWATMFFFCLSEGNNGKVKSHSYAFLRQGGRLCAQSIPEYDNLFWSQGLIEIQASKIAFLFVFKSIIINVCILFKKDLA